MGMFKKRQLVRRASITSLITAGLCWGWVHWGNWPEIVSSSRMDQPDLMVVLGGGFDNGRPEIAVNAIRTLRPKIVFVTGDGDRLRDHLLQSGVGIESLRHDTTATSTYENATASLPVIQDLQARRVVLVTNDFHAFRSRAVFQSVCDPDVRIEVFHDLPLGQRNSSASVLLRRERYAMLFYAFRYGILPW